MFRPGRDRLSGRVEVEETYLGGLEEGTHGRGTTKKALIAVAAQEEGNGVGRIRMRQVENPSAKQLHRFVEESVEPDSVVHTDGWEVYTGLPNKGYMHEVTVLSQREESVSDLLPRGHRVASLLKRWLMGTHQGTVSHEHLAYYLDEFTFRFNRHRSRHPGEAVLSPAATSGLGGTRPVPELGHVLPR